MTVLVVAAGSGMGRAIGLVLGRAHGPVGLIARRPEVLAEITAALADQGVSAAGFPADITDDESLRSAIAAAKARQGPANVVVFNASVWVPGPPTTMSLERFRVGLATGLTAAVVTVQAVADDLRAAAPNATLLFTGSGTALVPSAADIGLAIQKAGVRHLALATAEELGPDGVQVSTVTIRGNLKPGSALDPDRIAEVYAKLAASGTNRPFEVTVGPAGADWGAA